MMPIHPTAADLHIFLHEFARMPLHRSPFALHEVLSDANLLHGYYHHSDADNNRSNSETERSNLFTSKMAAITSKILNPKERPVQLHDGRERNVGRAMREVSRNLVRVEIQKYFLRGPRKGFRV